MRPSVSLFLLCAVRTGLRLGEVLGLQWGDLDFAGRFIEVRRQFTKGRLDLTKSGKIRRVDMSRQLSEAFRQTQEIRETELTIEGREFDPEEPIFRNGAGHRLDPSRVSKTILRRCLLLAGLRHIRFHDLRHANASLLLANRESLVYVKDQLGHHSIQITVDTYGHLIPGANKAAVDKLDTATICNPHATPRHMLTPDLSVTPEKESVGGGVWESPPPSRQSQWIQGVARLPFSRCRSGCRSQTRFRIISRPLPSGALHRSAHSAGSFDSPDVSPRPLT